MPALAAAVRERPILFSSAMVRALLDGRKTQTRRVITPQPTRSVTALRAVAHWARGKYRSSSGSPAWSDQTHFETFLLNRCPYGQPGEQLWVRETFWHCYAGEEPNACIFLADAGTDRLRTAATEEQAKFQWRFQPSIHMPRWASRLQLEVTGISVERVQQVTEADAIAEGLAKLSKDNGQTWKYGIPEGDGLPGSEPGCRWTDWSTDPRAAFRLRWDLLNGKRGFGWVENPWVWVVDFKVVKGGSK